MIALLGGPLAWLASPLLKVGKWLLIAGIVVLALLGLERYIRNRGKLESKVEGLEGAIKTIETRKRIERRAKEMTDEEIDQWLTPPSQRRKR
jgi:hypothetical protein